MDPKNPTHRSPTREVVERHGGLQDHQVRCA